MQCLFYFLLTIALCHCNPPNCKPTTIKPLPPPRKAIVRLQGPIVNGNVTFTQPYYGGVVTIEGNITGLTTGKYGFHVHNKGDITGGCASTGPHFNPSNRTHGAPEDSIRHIGDLGNIITDENNVTKISIKDSVITLIGEYSIIGRGVVVHGREDDLGKTDHVDSKTTGNAGPRVSCGVIGIM